MILIKLYSELQENPRNKVVYRKIQEYFESIKMLNPDIRFLGDDYVGKKFTGDDLGIEIYYHKRSNHTFSTTNLRKIVYEREKQKQHKI